MRKILFAVLLLLTPGLACAGSQQIRTVIGMAKAATGADETFNATGYDLGASWTETDSGGVVDPDNTTQVVGGQSLYINQNLSVTENFTCYDFGAGASSRSVTLKMYFDTLTLPATNDTAWVVSLGSDNVTPSNTEGVLIQAANLSSVLKLQGRGVATGTALDYSGVADTWVDVSISYTQNGSTSITINGSSTNVTAPDVAARYLCLGGVGSFDADEVAQIYFDDADGL